MFNQKRHVPHLKTKLNIFKKKANILRPCTNLIRGLTCPEVSLPFPLHNLLESSQYLAERLSAIKVDYSIFNHFKPFEDIQNQRVLNKECCGIVKLGTALKWPTRQRG